MELFQANKLAALVSVCRSVFPLIKGKVEQSGTIHILILEN